MYKYAYSSNNRQTNIFYIATCALLDKYKRIFNRNIDTTIGWCLHIISSRCVQKTHDINPPWCCWWNTSILNAWNQGASSRPLTRCNAAAKVPTSTNQATVDGWNPANHQGWWLSHYLLYRVITIPGGAGFQPSTVSSHREKHTYHLPNLLRESLFPFYWFPRMYKHKYKINIIDSQAWFQW